jgi:hypothetical protein
MEPDGATALEPAAITTGTAAEPAASTAAHSLALFNGLPANAFLERKLRPPPTPGPRPSSWFQQARDWTAFVVALTSLATALIALRNTLTGPRPFLSSLVGDSITVLRSDQFTFGLPLRDETGNPVNFPLLLIQPALGNRAPPPNGVGVRAIESNFRLSLRGKTLFQSPYVWYRFTESSAALDNGATADHIVFQSASIAAPFDLPGGATWSREVLLIPKETRAALNWDTIVGVTLLLAFV